MRASIIYCRSDSRLSKGVPHATTRSDIYKGYYIPKGMSISELEPIVVITAFERRNCRREYLVRDQQMIVVAETHTTMFCRAMSYDEDRYSNPEAFIPERFLDAQGQLIEDDPAEIIFGFGRRVCPGKPQPF